MAPLYIDFAPGDGKSTNVGRPAFNGKRDNNTRIKTDERGPRGGALYGGAASSQERENNWFIIFVWTPRGRAHLVRCDIE